MKLRKILSKLVFLFLILTFSLEAKTLPENSVLSLQKCVQIALENNPEIISARSKVKEAQGKLGEAYALLLPSLKTNYSLTRYYSDPTLMHIEGFGPNSDITIGYKSPYNIYKTGIELSENFFTGQTIPTILIAQNNLKAARQNLRKVTNEVAIKVTECYYNCLKALEFFKLGRQALTTSEANLKQVQVMLGVGVATRADLLQAQVNSAEAEQNFISAENSLQLARYAFNNALGRSLETPIIIRNIDYQQEISWLNTSGFKVGNLLKGAFEKRPDWLELNYHKKIAEQSVGLAASGYWPVLFGNFSYDWQNAILPEGQWNYTRSWAAVAGVSLSLFDGGGTPGRVLQAQAKLHDFQAQLEAARRLIELEVKQALLNLDSSKKQFLVASKAVALARENLRIAAVRFEAQAGTEFEVLTAQTNLTRAQANLIQTAFEFLIAWEKLKEASGENLVKI
jgi:outer membrane protein TolC